MQVCSFQIICGWLAELVEANFLPASLRRGWINEGLLLNSAQHLWNNQIRSVSTDIVRRSAPYWGIPGGAHVCKQVDSFGKRSCLSCPLTVTASSVLQVSCWASRGPKGWPRSFVRRTAPNASTWLWFTHRCQPCLAPHRNDPNVRTVAYGPPQSPGPPPPLPLQCILLGLLY